VRTVPRLHVHRLCCCTVFFVASFFRVGQSAEIRGGPFAGGGLGGGGAGGDKPIGSRQPTVTVGGGRFVCGGGAPRSVAQLDGAGPLADNRGERQCGGTASPLGPWSPKLAVKGCDPIGRIAVATVGL